MNTEERNALREAAEKIAAPGVPSPQEIDRYNSLADIAAVLALLDAADERDRLDAAERERDEARAQTLSLAEQRDAALVEADRWRNAATTQYARGVCEAADVLAREQTKPWCEQRDAIEVVRALLPATTETKETRDE